MRLRNMNGNLTTKEFGSSTKNKESCPKPIRLPDISRRRSSFAIAKNGEVKTLLNDDDCRKQELLLLPSLIGTKRRTYSVSQSSRAYTTSTTDTFSSESSGEICLYFDNERKDRWSRNPNEIRPTESCASSSRTQNCYRWVIPSRIYVPRAESSVEYSDPLIGHNRRMEYVYNPNVRNERIISVQPRPRDARYIPNPQARHLWHGMTRGELERYLQKRSLKVSRNASRSRPSKSRSSISSFDSYKSRVFRSCPSCFGTGDSGGSDYSSSDEDDGGSDTENEDCERGNDDVNFGDGDNSNISDQDDSSGGSDSQDSDDSFNLDYSFNSSLYDEDIMINEEKALAEVGLFDSDDEEFDLEDADGHGNLSSDSFTDSDEFFRDDNDDPGIHYHDDDDDFDNVVENYDYDGMT